MRKGHVHYSFTEAFLTRRCQRTVVELVLFHCVGPEVDLRSSGLAEPRVLFTLVSCNITPQYIIYRKIVTDAYK